MSITNQQYPKKPCSKCLETLTKNRCLYCSQPVCSVCSIDHPWECESQLEITGDEHGV